MLRMAAAATLALEKQVALSAVLRASALTAQVFKRLVQNETLVKGDKSPVTVADYSAQAVISTILHAAFPSDPIVGEEDAAELRAPDSALANRITELANDALALPLRDWERPEWGIGPGSARTTAQLLDAIDRGSHTGGRTGRMWTIDPVDGTKGFLRGEQYAVCLALIEDADVKLGAMGCPNLPLTGTDDAAADKGCIFLAVKGQGAEQRPISAPENVTPIRIPSRKTAELRTLESVEAAHSSHSFTSRIAHHLGITAAPVRMDSQAKYCSLARGDGDVYLRMPTGVGYVEKIWDHAGGSLLVTEAGGVVSDSRGQPLDFGLGRTLGENFGVIACGKDVHAAVLDAVQKARAEESQSQKL